MKQYRKLINNKEYISQIGKPTPYYKQVPIYTKTSEEEKENPEYKPEETDKKGGDKLRLYQNPDNSRLSY